MSGFSRLHAINCILQNTATQRLETCVQLSPLHLCLDCSTVVSDTRATGAERRLCAVLHHQYDTYEIDGILGAELLHDVLAMYLDRSPTYAEIPGSLLV
jgi:hypothetical protein